VLNGANGRYSELWLNNATDNVKNVGDVFLWHSNRADDGFHSILDFVENNDFKLRAKYLSFIHDVGQHIINGQSIAHHLCDSKGYSVWWMSKINERSHINSPQLTDCLKLFALEEMLVDHKVESLTVYAENDDKNLLKSITTLCKNLEIQVVINITKSNKSVSGYSLLRTFRPEILSALLYFCRYIKAHWKLRKSVSSTPDFTKNSIMFFSYFFNLDVDKCSSGNFHSNQWGRLPEYIHNQGKGINWLHHFMKFEGMRDSQTANSWIDSFNENPKVNGGHAFFESYLSATVILKTLRSFLKYSAKSFMLSNIRSAFRPKDSANDFWPVLKNDWIASVRGAATVRNCMFVELIDKALRGCPQQKVGFYLQENQFWERALVHAWRKHGHGTIVGVPHASVNFWDLRYFDDIRTLEDNTRFAQPQPDLMALHGPAAVKHFENAGYPSSRVVEVEALRYEHIYASKLEKNNGKSNTERDITRVIIIGEIKLDSTIEMLEFIASTTFSNLNINYTFKPHPACGFEKYMIKFPGLLFTSEHLNDVHKDFDFAIIAGSTSAAIDLYYSDINLMVYLGKNELNLSPLRESDNVSFIRSASDFKEVMSHPYEEKNEDRLKDEIFWTHPDINRWADLLKKWEI
jgi:surface carbohydrate biosynthesis protein (TIGR04326 family)